MFGRVIRLFVDTHNNSDIFICGRSRNHNFLCAADFMFLGIRSFSKASRRFDDDIRADRSPLKGSGILLSENGELLATHRNRLIIVGDS